MDWNGVILIMIVGITAGVAADDCPGEGRFPDSSICGAYVDCVDDGNGGYNARKGDCDGFMYNATSGECSKDGMCVNSRHTRSVTPDMNPYSHLCEAKPDGFLCANCKTQVMCVQGQAFVRHCIEGDFCLNKLQFAGGVCYPGAPVQCTCERPHEFRVDYYDPQRFFACAESYSEPVAYKCLDGMAFHESSSQCLNNAGFPPCTVSGVFANPNNCGEYYTCIALRHGFLQRFSMCSNNTLFNEKTQTCEDPCIYQFECQEDGRFGDPLNVRYYFECVVQNGQMKKSRYSCPEGYIWYAENPGVGRCVEDNGDYYFDYPFRNCKNPGDLCHDQNYCAQAPCYPGVICRSLSVAPHFICGPCPAGFTGDGITCKGLECPVGYAGTSGECARDSDLDGYPDSELNGWGNVCDNCPAVSNPSQKDTDGDEMGDECDDDIDNDGTANINDNCRFTANANQNDLDRDGLGDDDGVEDSIDNCPDVANSDQSDVDGDGSGDACDTDSDGDGVDDTGDNCALIPNSGQLDSDGDGRGDACTNDFDGDQIVDTEDVCINNPRVRSTDFRKLQTVALNPGAATTPPVWVIHDNGTEIHQLVNSDPAIALGDHSLGNVDFEGTFFIEDLTDDDFVGFVFSYQSNAKFYVMMWKQATQRWFSKAERGFTLKLINSRTGPGTELRDALWVTRSTKAQAKLLWQDNRIGWSPNVAYRWLLHHRPGIGTMRFYLYKGDYQVTDSGNIYDDTLKGGRLGLFCFSQEKIIWSNIKYTCSDDIPADMAADLNSRP
ncbi:thrombospondin [Penaeus vannamei]|uniref:Thrombospondin n=1 Tax=Penaeus vannamei TaxID=6689 RepID=A0A3R7MCB5_PENVA|nr:thrombospondin [Penaeus vannamei]